MHMADALISAQVGGTMWAVSAGIITCCSRKLRTELDSSTIPLMGVLGAFIFTAQMINFTIPVTGSSGHLGGGLLLAVLLGPYAAFITISSVLAVQALFFADGGLLALGCNIFNLGFFPAFVAYPLVYRKIAGCRPSPARVSAASLTAAIVALQMGAFAVVLETLSSGISALPFTTFTVMMQPIHLAIGIAEGLVTASVVSFIYKARPEIIQSAGQQQTGGYSMRKIVLILFAVTLITGVLFSRFASEKPDGLEWSVSRVTGRSELIGPKLGLHDLMYRIQNKFAFMPGYSFRKAPASEDAPVKREDPDNSPGTGLAGVIGGTMILVIVLLAGVALKRRTQPD